MSKETKCGNCINLVETRCLKLRLFDVYQNHTTFHTLESHGKLDAALNLLVDPTDTCFEGYPFPEVRRLGVNSFR